MDSRFPGESNGIRRHIYSRKSTVTSIRSPHLRPYRSRYFSKQVRNNARANASKHVKGADHLHRLYGFARRVTSSVSVNPWRFDAAT